MKARLAAAIAALLSTGTPVAAHRLDEYLEATVITVEKDRLQFQLRLAPGVAVSSFVLANIDTDGDGVLSESEQRAYADRVLRDLTLTVDGDRLRPQLVSAAFPSIAEVREGLGEILLQFTAVLPRHGPNRRLVFENHHQSPIAAYLVNCLVPRDPEVRLIAQNRNYSQSSYQLDYVQAGVRSGPPSFAWWFGAAVLLLAARLIALAARSEVELGA